MKNSQINKYKIICHTEVDISNTNARYALSTAPVVENGWPSTLFFMFVNGLKIAWGQILAIRRAVHYALFNQNVGGSGSRVRTCIVMMSFSPQFKIKKSSRESVLYEFQCPKARID